MMTTPDLPPNVPFNSTSEQFDAARWAIHCYTEQEDSPLGLYELLRQLGEEVFPTTDDMFRLMHLIYRLQADPNIRMLTTDWDAIEFEWSNEKREHGLHGLGGMPV